MEFLIKPLVQGVKGFGELDKIGGGWQAKQPFDDFLGGLPAVAVTAHAIEHGEPSVSGWPIGQPQLGFLFVPQQAGLAQAVHGQKIILVFTAAVTSR